ncbi:MAG: hypothetical protein AAF378_18980 [Cyanobacteria bacterium P01_A01_bin.84]
MLLNKITPSLSLKLVIPLITTSTALLFTQHSLANNAVLRSMFSCQAQGLGGVTPTINIWYNHGTNLSFIPAGEVIKKVWIDDPTQVTLDFDGPMCIHFGKEGNNSSSKVGDCEKSAANVIHLKRIEPIEIPGLPAANRTATLLTVVTEGKGYKKRLYTFRVVYEDGMPEYNTLAIFADPPSTNENPCVRGK